MTTFQTNLQTPLTGSAGDSGQAAAGQDTERIPFLHTQRSGGRTYYYFRRGKIRRALPSPDDPAFDEAYRTAFDLWARGGTRPAHANDLRRATAVLVGRARQRALQKGWAFDLTAADVFALMEAQGLRCAMTGLEFSMRRPTTGRTNPYGPSLDRIDCAGGYVPGNVRVVIAAVNMALNEWGEATLRAIAAALISHPSRRPTSPSPERG